MNLTERKKKIMRNEEKDIVLSFSLEKDNAKNNENLLVMQYI